MFGTVEVSKSSNGYRLNIADMNYDSMQEGPFPNLDGVRVYLDKMAHAVYLSLDRSIPDVDRDFFSKYSFQNMEPVRTH